MSDATENKGYSEGLPSRTSTKGITMSKPEFGAAIRISEDNKDKISILNGGVPVELYEYPTYFVYPFDGNDPVEGPNQILSETTFNQLYEFVFGEKLNSIQTIRKIS